MSVHYKFKSALEYDTVTFDGLHISVKDLKNSIIQQKRIGKNTDFDLQVTNAQTKEVYEDEETLIPKNTSLLIARIPVTPSNKSKNWEGYGNDSTPIARTEEVGAIAKAVDLSSLDASEDDKIRAMISQSTQDYDPSNYMKIRGANQVGVVPLNYRCYKCHQQGHWIKDCPLSQGPEPVEIKKSTGIPRSFMVPVEGPQVQGAMMTPNGSYAVPVLDHQTYTQKQQPAPPVVQEEQPEIPEDLICSICSGLLTDAVMIPCCGNSFCDECIRGSLLESEEHECPDCHERDISPVTLIPNRYLRNSVANFKNTTGYIKKPTFRQPSVQKPTAVVDLDKNKGEEVKSVEPKSAEKEDKQDVALADSAEKTVISEADSTEQSKATSKAEDVKEEREAPETKRENSSKASSSEGPPGVSPRREKSPKRAQSKRTSHSSNHTSHTNGRTHRNSRDLSPRRHGNRHNSPYESNLSRIEERAGTPTVDEPGNTMVSNSGNYPNAGGPYPSAPPHGVLPSMMGMPPHHMQGPPPNYQQGQPPPGVYPSQGPPPNYRLPPPGANPPGPYMGPYNAPPRPMFDHSRPPLQGPPPNFGNFPPRTRSRDYGASRMRTRTPPGIIDDPLEAFNRMLREKDERERRAKQRKGRSYSRSTSRSYSRSPKRGRSRSPRRRGSRSRSRSFSMSRSRSRSFSPSPRNASPYREYSPRNASPRCRRPSSRYRSPARSPQRYRYKEAPIGERNRDRDYDRHPPRDRDRGYSRDRDYGYHYDRDRAPGRWPANARPLLQDSYYPPEVHPLQHPSAANNRYPQRDTYPPFKPEPPHHMPPQLMPPVHHLPPRRYDDIAPPGTDQPPIPGEEIPPRYEERYNPYNPEAPAAAKERFSVEREGREQQPREKEERRKEDDKRKYDGYGRSPQRKSSPPEQRGTKAKERHESPDKHKRRRHDTPEKERGEKRDDRHKRETSDDERLRKGKDKKKKREKRDQDKKKRREKREKHEKRKDDKEQKKKEKDGNEGAEEKMHPTQPVDEASTNKRVEEKKKLLENEEPPKEEKKEKDTLDLYGDFLQDGVDTKVIESYGKLESLQEEPSKTPEIKHPQRQPEEDDIREEGEYPPESETSKDEDVLDIHTNESELKSELDKEVLAPLPEKSKWEIDDDISPTLEAKAEGKQERSGKVTNEVLKRAENAIFAKAINAIRPIEIKKISVDRAKLYSDQKKPDESARTIATTAFNFEDETLSPSVDVKVESEIQKPPRLSVKERLGVKVDDIDRIVKVSFDRNRSRSLSPLSKRARDDQIHLGRHMEADRRPDSRSRYERDRHGRNYSRPSEHDDRRREGRRDERPRSKSHGRKDESKRKRSRTRSPSKEHRHKKKDKKQKKERGRKHKKDEKEDDKKEDVKSEAKPKPTADRRKPTLDEASFEPDYDLESESEKEEAKTAEEPHKKVRVEEKKESSSSDSSDSSSEEERRKKKHRKHKKKRSRKDSTSSSSSSESDSSDEERERKRKKHKKKQKKRKKSKHK